ncbi:redoxin domain-containing protein [Sphingobacterium sp. DK4209]|uniref:Redoxin domain-containing protein n=1 Tax=Sphingobacterium zhuxiongii TaxID=2662364 RepID=A0A5Q0QDI9_9SPHI|nr:MULTISPECIES: TlpA disulfide reductase family protein [unclassified Sphingobacterium]MVZ65697.1 redoxin domain-containing protein [Sphingobacterium sp. DK4209]QGA27895.1 redoxin domain-containing protein [Sphingobacterium sp. dk4302]
MRIRECLLSSFFILLCAFVSAQSNNPLAVFQEIPKIARQVDKTTPDSLEIIYQQFKKDYPLKQFIQVNGMMDQVRLALIDRFIKLNNKRAFEIATELSDNKIRWQQLERSKKLTLSRKGAKELMFRFADLELSIPERKFLWQNQTADLLYFSNNAKVAFAYLKGAGWGDSDFDKSPLLGAHIYSSLGNDEKAVTLLADWVKNGNADQYVKDKLAFFYERLPNKTSSFEAYQEALMKDLQDEKWKEKSQYEVSYVAPKFDLLDLQGKRVSLESLRGKVVVLDFWATWCKPCLAAFPAMNIVKDRFKDNPNVVFLFVNTLERKKSQESRMEQIELLLQDRGLNFDVLIDIEQESGFKMASAYDVSSIPAQFIIDTNGIVKYKLGGFNGNIDSMVEELNVLINSLLKGE